ncbi:MAG: hypothetical protein JSV78_05855 [Phycisphaerales bacterium]|nr:MAG: hypothetical protein JSV78_05855 [Phycisphaerales bacterium]
MKRTCLIALTLAVAFGFALARPAHGQVITSPGFIWNSAGGGAQGERAPGNMVSSGLARAQEVFPDPLRWVEVVEPYAAGVRTQILVTVIDTVFNTLNSALALLQDAIIARISGEDPSGTDGTSRDDGSDLSGLSGLTDQIPSGST